MSNSIIIWTGALFGTCCTMASTVSTQGTLEFTAWSRSVLLIPMTTDKTMRMRDHYHLIFFLVCVCLCPFQQCHHSIAVTVPLLSIAHPDLLPGVLLQVPLMKVCARCEALVILAQDEKRCRSAPGGMLPHGRRPRGIFS